MLSQLIAALQSAALEMTAEEIADMLWLALQISSALGQPGAAADMRSDANQLLEKQNTQKMAQTPATDMHMNPRYADGDSTSDLTGLPFRSPAASALPNALSLARALRPLMNRLSSKKTFLLNENATVQAIAEAQNNVWLPILEPAPMRWFDIALVIDEGASMMLWKDTIAELRALLEQQGAFRDVRVWRLATDDKNSVQLYAESGSTKEQDSTRNPKELIDPGGHRLILVVTDCVSLAWHSGEVQQLLDIWGKKNLVTLIQMLPYRLWHQTALEFAHTVRITPSLQEIANASIKTLKPFQHFDEDIPFEISFPIPVITLEPRSLLSWARVVTGSGDTWITGKVFEKNPAKDGDDHLLSIQEEPILSAQQRVQLFHTNASQIARRLAGLLAATSGSIDLHTIRLIQHTMLPEAGQVHIAEVLLSGLLEEVYPAEIVSDSDYVAYNFIAGVRAELRNAVPIHDSQRVSKEISAFIGQRYGQTRDVLAFVTLQEQPHQSITFFKSEEHSVITQITTTALRRFGGDFASLAENIEQQSRLVDAQSTDDLTEAPEQHLHELVDSVLDTVYEQTSQQETVTIETTRRDALFPSLKAVGQSEDGRTKDFFISYAGANVVWAEWIAQQLVQAKYTVIRQSWDFHAGKSFIYQMEEAMASSRCTIAVLSPHYLAARYTQPEWQDAFRRDPAGTEGVLVPVRVEECSLEGILPRLVYIDLVGLNEGSARERLLAGVASEYRPAGPVKFPGPGGEARPLLPSEGLISDELTMSTSSDRYPGDKPVTWNVPYERNPLYIPHEETMKEIKETLAAGKPVALISNPQTASMTTQAAVEFTYRYQGEYSAVLWVRADAPQDLIADFVKLAFLLNLPEKQEASQQTKIEAVKRWLQTQPDWLLVLANVKDPPLVQSFLPLTYRGHVLITSQELSTSMIGQVIDMRRLNPEENEITRNLSQVVGAILSGPFGKIALGLMGVSIGRDATNDIVLPEDTVSARHAEIRLREQGYGITDRSTNGTFLNQKRLQPRISSPLKHNDQIRIGQNHFLYEVGSVLCPQCGTPNPPDAAFCKQDHYPLTPGGTLDPPSATSIRCPKCGRLNRAGARFCRYDRVSLTTTTNWMQEGDSFYQQKNYQEAYKAYDRASQVDPSQASAHFGLGNTLIKLQRYNDALASYEQATKINPSDALIHQRKGNAWYLLERYDEALAAYELAIQLDTHLALAYNGKGNVLYKLEQYSDALEAYAQAISYKPAYAEAYTGSGNVQHKLGNYNEALQLYEKALSLEPHLASAHNGKGNVLYVHRKYTEALAAYDQALAIDARMFSSHVGRGNTLLELGLYQAALEAYEQALRIAPNDKNALAGKGMVYNRQGRS